MIHDLLAAASRLLDDPGWRLVVAAWMMFFIIAWGLALSRRFHDPRSW